MTATRDAAPVRTTEAGAKSGLSTHGQATANQHRLLTPVAIRSARWSKNQGTDRLDTARARADALFVACSALAAGRFVPTPKMLGGLAELAAALAFDLYREEPAVALSRTP
jgi:hypothetical protein